MLPALIVIGIMAGLALVIAVAAFCLALANTSPAMPAEPEVPAEATETEPPSPSAYEHFSHKVTYKGNAPVDDAFAAVTRAFNDMFGDAYHVTIKCAVCSQRNRVSRRSRGRINCGRCKQQLLHR